MAVTDGVGLPAGSAGYEAAGYDEAFCAPGRPRAHYAPLLQALTGTDLDALERRVTEQVRASGCSFGGDAGTFVIDPVPRLITAAEWSELEAGLSQRLRALNAFVDDMYHERRALAAGVLPERVVSGVSFLEDDMRDVRPQRAWIAIAGLDVVRGADGRFRVLEDNVRTPSGMAYALAARRAVGHHLPYAGRRRDIAVELAGLLRGVIAAARPDPEADGISVLLSDGPSNSAWFEHVELAELGEIRLARLDELIADGDRLALRDGRRVQVVYRRTNEDRLRDDTGELTPVGERLLPALRAGTVAMVNAFGTGVADDKLVYPYVDDLVRFYLGEDPQVCSVPTFDLADPGRRAEALDRLDELVVKPRDGHGGHGVLIGPAAGRAELGAAREAIEAAPEEWVAQELVQLSSHPTVIDGRLAPRHIDVRPFVFFDGRDVRALPGGLTRVALREGELIVNSSRGGGGKDTWVLPS